MKYHVSYISPRIYEEVNTGAQTFSELTDTPPDFSGQGGKVLKVKPAEDGVEFGEVAPDSFSGLSDTPNDYTGQAQRVDDAPP